jgi:hypothetical protein
MAMAKKGSRLIEVEGVRYRWGVALCDEPGVGKIVVEAADMPGQRIESQFDFGNVISISPWLVREAILYALSQGWHPQTRGPAYGFWFDALNVQKMRQNRVIDLCNQALGAVKDVISTRQYRDAHDTINKHGEHGLAIENLIDWICEDGTRITDRQFQDIEKAMEKMGMGDADRVQYLRQHNVVQP